MDKATNNVEPLEKASRRGVRENLLSIAVIGNGVQSTAETVRRSVSFLEENFEFFEVLVLVPAATYEAHADKFAELSNLQNVRLLLLREGVGHYRCAMIAATEAIGDHVVILAANEARLIDLQTVTDTAVSGEDFVILRRGSGSGPLGSLLGRMLSAISGYEVDPGFLRSAAYSRAHVGRIARRSDRDIALRYMPRAGKSSSDARILEIPDKSGPFRWPSLSSRIGHGIEVLANSPPHLLRALAAGSFFVAFCAVLFFFYAMALFLLGVDLQPGWLSTTIAISGSSAVMGLALAGILTALYQILSLLRDDAGDEILREVGNVDLFAGSGRLNVESLEDE